MKVKLRGDISGSRDGQPWPPAGTELDLPDDEAATLCANGSAIPVGSNKAGEEHAVVLDEATEARVKAATTTRERQSRSKRAHEPLNPGLADDDQPAEDENGPRLSEVHAEESANVENPGKSTESADTGSKSKSK
jgi:hypothetical protein